MKSFRKPEVEVIRYEAVDVIVTSLEKCAQKVQSNPVEGQNLVFKRADYDD